MMMLVPHERMVGSSGGAPYPNIGGIAVAKSGYVEE